MVAEGPSPDVGYQEIKKWAYSQENELIQSQRSYSFLKRLEDNVKYPYEYNHIRNLPMDFSLRSRYWSEYNFTGMQSTTLCGYFFGNKGLVRTFPTKFENDPKKRVKVIRANKKLILDNLIAYYGGDRLGNYNATRNELGGRLVNLMDDLLINEHYSNIIKRNTHINKLFIQEVIPCLDEIEKTVDNIVLGVVDNPIAAIAELRKKWFNHFSLIFDPYDKGGEFYYQKGKELRLCNNLK